MFSKKVIIITAIVFFIIGFMVSLLIFNGGPLPADSGNTFAAGWQAAQERLIKAGIIQPVDESIPVNNLDGIITAINGSLISLAIVPLAPLADPQLDTRLVEIGSQTKIYALEAKEEMKYNQELEEFYANNKDNLSADGLPAGLPQPYNKKQINLADLNMGDNITVQAGFDIRNQRQFTAEEIIAQN